MGNTDDKKYYLKDNALTTVDDDFFRHQDVTNNIIKILETTNPPYNIAVIGKWGLGKSSLINMVSKYLESNPTRYMKIEINAWKYEKEVLAKVFLRQVKQGLFPKEQKQTTLDQFKEIALDIIKEVKTAFSHPIISAKKLFSKERRPFSKYVKIAVLYVLGSLMLYSLYKLIDFGLVSGWPESIGNGIGLIVTGYAKNMGEIVCGPLLLVLLTRIYEEIKSSKNDFELKVPAIGVEDYEIYLEREISRKLQTLPEDDRDNFKIVIVLDDLDRLSVPKMVEALDAIKMFINFKNCIFIVPFDDAILKNAIEKKRLNPMDDIEIQSELLLDKLFQYKVYLPQLLTYDIKKYAQQLCQKQIPDFVRDYMNNDWTLFNDVLRHILIHNEIETPRQVKKIVNAFISNMMIAHGRQEAGNTEADFATKKENIYIIAKISVLQSDFNEFYDLLFVVDKAMELSLDAYQGRMEINTLPSELRRYFGLNAKSITFPKSSLPLMNFLLSTNRYKAESIYPYLYMAMDDISIKTGSKRQQEFRKILLSRNFVAAREQLKELPDLIDVGIHILSDENDLADISSTFFSLIDTYDLTTAKDKVVKFVASVCDEVVGWIDIEDENSINYKNMLSMYVAADSEEKYELGKLLSYCLKSINSTRILEKAEVFIAYHSSLGADLINDFNEYVKYILSNRLISPEEFISLRKKHSLEYHEKWSMSYFTYLINTIGEFGDFSDENIDELEAIYKYIAEPDNADAIFKELEKLFGATRLDDFFKRILELEVSKSIKIETVSKLIKEQLEAEMENTEEEETETEINPLLTAVLYNIDEDNSEIYDNYFMRYCQQYEFISLIENYCRTNDISYLNSSVEKFTMYLFENITIETEGWFREIVDLLDETQVENIRKKLETELTYSSSKSAYSDIGTILEIYSNDEERFEQIKPALTKWISYMYTNSVTSVYVDFMVECISHVIQYFDDLNRGKLFDALVKKGNEGKLSDTAMNILCDMSDYISEEDYEKIVPTLCTKVTEQTCIAVFYLMDKHWNIIAKSKDYNDYLKIALMTMKEERYINDVVQKLGKHFSGVTSNKLKNMLTCMMNSKKIDINGSVNIFAKFIDYHSQKTIADMLFEILLEEGFDKKLAMIFKSCEKNSLKTVVKYIITVSGEYALTDLMNLANFVVYIGESNMNEELLELVSLSIHKLQTEDENLKLGKILCDMNKQQYRGLSKQYAPLFATMVEKTSSTKLKQKLADKAKEIRIFKDIKGLLDEKLQKEWLNYVK